MSKIICDVCGTSYPDTATQCPICGCVRSADSQSISRSPREKGEPAEGYTYVKGGRFSKTNVRKRNKASGVVSVNMVKDTRKSKRDSDSGNKALVITAIVLFLAIIAVVLYISFRYFVDQPDTEPGKQPAQTTESAEQSVPCEGIEINVDSVITLKEVGETKDISVKVMPEDTTDLVAAASEDETVVYAVAKGNAVTLKAVGAGETTVTVTCGDKKVEFAVECTFEEEKELKLLHTEIELTEPDATEKLYEGTIPVEEIEWTSEDTTVATVKNGIVTAVGEGDTVIQAVYKAGTENEQTAECVVICTFPEEDDSGSSGNSGSSGGNSGMSGAGGEGVTEDGGDSGSSGGGYALTSLYGGGDDISLSLSSTENNVAYLKLVDSNGNTVSGVSWSTGNADYCTVADGKVSAVGVGTTTVTATYNGQTYKCIIRVNS